MEENAGRPELSRASRGAWRCTGGWCIAWPCALSGLCSPSPSACSGSQSSCLQSRSWWTGELWSEQADTLLCDGCGVARACCGAELGRRLLGFYREEASMYELPSSHACNLANPRGQISEPECSLLFLSATKSMISLTDRIVSDNRQLILPLLPAYVSKSADSAVLHGWNEGTWYLVVLHAAGILIYPLGVLLCSSMLHLEGSLHCELSALDRSPCESSRDLLAFPRSSWSWQ